VIEMMAFLRRGRRQVWLPRHDAEMEKDALKRRDPLDALASTLARKVLAPAVLEDDDERPEPACAEFCDRLVLDEGALGDREGPARASAGLLVGRAEVEAGRGEDAVGADPVEERVAVVTAVAVLAQREEVALHVDRVSALSVRRHREVKGDAPRTRSSCRATASACARPRPA